jgi:hypothetical protein
MPPHILGVALALPPVLDAPALPVAALPAELEPAIASAVLATGAGAGS